MRPFCPDLPVHDEPRPHELTEIPAVSQPLRIDPGQAYLLKDVPVARSEFAHAR
jgi:hypothetical protein